jgi:hypothetical protein
MKTKECICEICKKQFLKPLKEFKRSEKFGRRLFCSRKCSGIGNLKNFKDRINRDTSSLKEYWEKNNYGRNEYSKFRHYIRSSKQRDKHFDIDVKYLKQIWDTQQGLCPLTGWELSLDRSGSLKQASLDRIDNNKGYEKNNVRFVALIANYCRNNFTDEQVKEFCHAVSKQHPSPPLDNK